MPQNLKRKLYSVYDNKILADTIVRGSNSNNVHALIEAIEEHRQVELVGYRSAHGGAVRDRHVEPFAFTTNYVQVWCYDIESGSCKLFKLSRIESVRVLDAEWQHAAEHEKAQIDIFRMNGKEPKSVKLELGILAHNLILEEFPLSENYLTPIGKDRWLLQTEVRNYAGVARFVIGLMDDIKIVDTPELEQYLADYVAKYWSNVIK